MVGMIAFLKYHMIRHYRFLKLAARWSEDVTDNRTLTLLQNLKAGMGLSRPMGLKVCGSIGTPMMVGFISPRILLPKADFSEDERKFYLKEAGFDSREEKLFRLRVYGEKTLWEASELMGYSPRTIDRINKRIKKKISKVAPMYCRGFSLYYGENVAK